MPPCRPGDTIWLAPGVHSVSAVAINWPLHVLGGGVTAEETRLVSPRGADAALDFRWGRTSGGVSQQWLCKQSHGAAKAVCTKTHQP